MFFEASLIAWLVRKVKSIFESKLSLVDLANHVDVLVEEQTLINYYFSVRHQFSLVVNQSPVAQSKNDFWEFVHLAFAHEIIIRLSRLFDRQFADKSTRVYSLYAFLLDVRRSCQLVSREHYVGAANQNEWIEKNPGRKFSEAETPDPYIFHHLNKKFDDLVGKDKVCLSKSGVDKNLKLLKKAMRNLDAYRNKTLAHNAVVKNAIIVRYEEITEAVDTMNKLIHKYYLLIKRDDHALNYLDPDITDLFMVPWIADEKDREAVISEHSHWVEQQRIKGRKFEKKDRQ